MKRTQSRKPRIVLCCITLLTLLFRAPSFAEQKKETKTASTPGPACTVPDPGPNTMTLDIVLEGTIALLQRQDGSIQVYFPHIPGHMSPYYLALNEGILAQNMKDYSIKTSAEQDLTPAPCTVIAPDPKYPILTVPYSLNMSIDPGNVRFATISLPRPYAILPLRSDPAELKASDPCDSPAGSNVVNFATRVALRYVVQNFSLSLLDPSNPATKLDIPQVGNSGSLFFGVGPEMPDDQTHHHARVSFQKLQDLFPIQRQFVAFPPGPDDARKRVRSGIDCRAPMLLLTPQ